MTCGQITYDLRRLRLGALGTDQGIVRGDYEAVPGPVEGHHDLGRKHSDGNRVTGPPMPSSMCTSWRNASSVRLCPVGPVAPGAR